MSKKHTPMNEFLKGKAKKEFMSYTPVKQIARDFNLSYAALKHYCKPGGRWRRERELLKAELLQKVTEGKRVELLGMADSCQIIVKKCLAALAVQHDPPTLRDAKMVTSILTELDKILRLDEGRPTDIIEEKPVSTIELQKKMGLDPFMEEIEYVEESKEDGNSVFKSPESIIDTSGSRGNERDLPDEGDRK